MFKKLNDLITKELDLLALKIQNETDKSYEIEYCRELGKQVFDILKNYAISDEEALSILKSVSEYVTLTRTTNIDWLLFKNSDKSKPRLKSDVRYIENIVTFDNKELH